MNINRKLLNIKSKFGNGVNMERTKHFKTFVNNR